MTRRYTIAKGLNRATTETWRDYRQAQKVVDRDNLKSLRRGEGRPFRVIEIVPANRGGAK